MIWGIIIKLEMEILKGRLNENVQTNEYFYQVHESQWTDVRQPFNLISFNIAR